MKKLALILLVLAAASWVGCQNQPPAQTTPPASTPAAAPATPAPAPPVATSTMPASTTPGFNGLDMAKPGKPIAAVTNGDLVWAKWSDNYYYPAIIDGGTGENLHVTYSDSDSGSVMRKDMLPWALQAGTVLESKWSGGGFWPAKVLGIHGNQLDVQFLDDNSKETHGIGEIRRK